MENTDRSRRPVGIAPEAGGGRLVVACDDGSIWTWHHDGERWEELAPIPGSIRAAVDVKRRHAGF